MSERNHGDLSANLPAGAALPLPGLDSLGAVPVAGSRFHALTETDLAALRVLCAPERVRTGDAVHEDYAHDEMPEYGRHAPDVLVEAVMAQEVSAVLRYAYAHDIPVTPRGSGTGLCGGAVAVHGGILLSLAAMNRILEIDEDNLTVTLEPGVLLMDLQKAVSERDLMYPPDPGEKSATVGGNVMTNAGGMRAVKYGVTRDYVREMDVVLPDGEPVTFGGKVAKNSSGYSLKDLLIGSEGTLGVVTRLVLRLVPLPKRTISLLVPFTDLDACIGTVPKIIRSRTVPAALEFMQREVVQDAETYLGRTFPAEAAEAWLLLRFDGADRAEIERAYDATARLCLDEGALDVFVLDTEERQDSVWAARGAFLEAIKSSTPEMDECDVVVPRNEIARFVRFVGTLSERFGVRIRSFGHAGDGNLHLYVCRDAMPEEAWRTARDGSLRAMYDEARRLSGQVSGEHGIGHAKRPFLVESVGETPVRLMAAIKAAFDPKGLLNPGKVCVRMPEEA